MLRPFHTDFRLQYADILILWKVEPVVRGHGIILVRP